MRTFFSLFTALIDVSKPIVVHLFLLQFVLTSNACLYSAI